MCSHHLISKPLGVEDSNCFDSFDWKFVRAPLRGAGGVACIIPEAKPLWLVGRATDEELFIWSAWEILGTLGALSLIHI